MLEVTESELQLLLTSKGGRYKGTVNISYLICFYYSLHYYIHEKLASIHKKLTPLANARKQCN